MWGGEQQTNSTRALSGPCKPLWGGFLNGSHSHHVVLRSMVRHVRENAKFTRNKRQAARYFPQDTVIEARLLQMTSPADWL